MARICGGDLSGADLTEANLGKAELWGPSTDLSGAHLTKADLRGALMQSANLTDADLRGANLSRAEDGMVTDLKDVNLRGANLSITDDGKVTDLSYADLRGANLSNDANGKYTNLYAATLYKADLGPSQGSTYPTILSGSCLARADLRGANLTSAKLDHADMRGANLREAEDRTITNLSHADLTGANLRALGNWRTALMNADLSWANFSDVHLEGSDFRWTDLGGATINQYQQGALRNAGDDCANGRPEVHNNPLDWTGDDPEYMRKTAPNFEGANMAHADLRGAIGLDDHNGMPANARAYDVAMKKDQVWQMNMVEEGWEAHSSQGKAGGKNI
jgi:uncharacterized protein YjbI with pentapeptide repeats